MQQQFAGYIRQQAETSNQIASALSKALDKHGKDLERVGTGLSRLFNHPDFRRTIEELTKSTRHSDALNDTGWLPHYTTPFDLIEKHAEEPDTLDRTIADHYIENWDGIHSEILTRVESYDINDETKETMREALDAHGAKLYRCVCRVLFPEIERVVRVEFPDDLRNYSMAPPNFLR